MPDDVIVARDRRSQLLRVGPHIGGRDERESRSYSSGGSMSTVSVAIRGFRWCENTFTSGLTRFPC